MIDLGGTRKNLAVPAREGAFATGDSLRGRERAQRSRSDPFPTRLC